MECYKRLPKEVQDFVIQNDDMLRLQREYMISCDERRANYKILLVIYLKTIERSVKDKNIKSLVWGVYNTERLIKEKREYFREMYEEYVKMNKGKTYINVYLRQNGEGNIEVEMYCAPFKIIKQAKYVQRRYFKETDEGMFKDGKVFDIWMNEDYIREHMRGLFSEKGWCIYAKCISECIMWTAENGDVDMLKWWFEEYKERYTYRRRQGIKEELQTEIIDRVSQTEEIDALDYLKNKFYFENMVQYNTDYRRFRELSVKVARIKYPYEDDSSEEEDEEELEDNEEYKQLVVQKDELEWKIQKTLYYDKAIEMQQEKKRKTLMYYWWQNYLQKKQKIDKE